MLTASRLETLAALVLDEICPIKVIIRGQFHRVFIRPFQDQGAATFLPRHMRSAGSESSNVTAIHGSTVIQGEAMRQR